MATVHDNNFDLIRLLAAVQVMVFHAIGHLELPITGVPSTIILTIGFFPGVVVFFIVSGFLISASYLRPAMTIPTFFEARALRIYPALWANLALMALMVAVGGGLAYTPDLWKWLGIAFVTGSDLWAEWSVPGVFRWDGFYHRIPSGVLWTLPIELSFYLLVPFILAKWLRRRGLLGVSLLAWLAVSLCVFWVTERRSYPDQIMKYLWIFLLGAVLSCYWQKVGWLLRGKAWLWVPAFLAVCFGARFFGHMYNYPVGNVVNVVQTALLAAAVVSLAFSWNGRSGRLLGGIDISYGLYLWHMPVVYTLKGMGIAGSWSAGALMIGVTVALALLSWFLVERPALDAKGFLKRLQKAPVPVAAPD